MGWGDSVEARRAASRGPALPSPDAPPAGGSRVARQQKRRSSTGPLLVAVAAAAVLLPVAQQLGWLGALERTLRRHGVRLPWRGGDDDDDGEEAGGRGTRSAFRFPKGAPARAKAGDTSSLPRNKQSANKKGKSRKAGFAALTHDSEVREERAQKREDTSFKGKAGGAGTLPEPEQGGGGGNSVPKDEDVLGGEAGKVFTTTTQYHTSAMYKRIREERGD